MSARVISLLVMLTLCGCMTPPTGAPAEMDDGFRREGHSGAPAEIDDGFRREGHSLFSPQEQKAVTAARQGIEQACGRRIDAYYRVRHTSDGYSVLALEIHRYEGNQPRFRVGSDWGVDLKEDGTVKCILRGGR